MTIHPTAIVEDGAQLGAGCVIHAYAIVTRHCVLGDGVVVHSFAVVGGDPQDLSFDPATRSGVRIGARTVIREHVTIHRATKADSWTEVGAGCFLMVSCHVAHDCRLADKVIMANAVLLAGHVHDRRGRLRRRRCGGAPVRPDRRGRDDRRRWRGLPATCRRSR